jgi:RNA polymerase sigma-70 factor, ECF subfamily
MDVDVPIAELVSRAQMGDHAAWTALVAEFNDVATGLAAGWSTDRTAADDIAQDAFVIAFERLGDLVDPQAFPAWFVTVVRSAAHRRTRRDARALPSPSAAAGTGTGTGTGPDPLDVVVSDDEAERLRDAVEHLPEHERSVIALHYLAGLPYARVAALLGISVSAAKKRAFSARQRLKAVLPASVAALAGARPSFRRLPDPVALFLAIRQRNRALVRELLARAPDLVSATETWSRDEAMDLGLQNAERATPLVRAVQTGDVELVRLILAAGADPDRRCECAGAESALWMAALVGDSNIVGVLITAGADVNTSAFAGASPLAVAAQRGHHDIARVLVAAGADASLADAGGRTAADWALARRSRSRRRSSPDLLATGVRALDLFAPIHRGSVQWWPAAWELGQFALLTEVVASIEPDGFWQIGFATGPYDAESGRQWIEQYPLATELHLTPAGRSRAVRRADFETRLVELDRAPGEKVVMILTAPGHHHDVTLAVARLADDPRVLTTIVIEPATAEVAPPQTRRPEGFDGQVAFDGWRALRRLWPAIDPRTTSTAEFPSDRHRALATSARTLLEQYRGMDPELELLGPDAYAQPEPAARAQRLLRYLAQPFRLWEHVTNVPGESTPYAELIDTIDRLLRP